MCIRDSRGDRERRLPFERTNRAESIARSNRHERIEQRAPHEWKDRLRFGIAEPTVELDDLRSLVREHEPSVEEAAEQGPALAKRPKHGRDDSRSRLPN